MPPRPTVEQTLDQITLCVQKGFHFLRQQEKALETNGPKFIRNPTAENDELTSLRCAASV